MGATPDSGKGVGEFSTQEEGLEEKLHDVNGGLVMEITEP